MPPNRKANVDVVDTNLINVNDLQPKFLPLTHPNNNETAQQQHKPQVVQQDEKQQQSQQEASHDAYWNWSADQDKKKDVINNILEEERIRNMLSAKHVEEKIAQDQQQEVDSSSSSDEIRAQNVDEDYWQWPAEEAVVHRANNGPAHPSQNY